MGFKKHKLLIYKELAFSASKLLFFLFQNLKRYKTTYHILQRFLFLLRQRNLNKTKRLKLKAENELITLKQDQLNKAVNHKNTEITEFAIHINDRNRMLQHFSDEIKALKFVTKEKETRDKLMNLQFYIEENLHVNQEKVALNKTTKNTEESFILKIKEQYPVLTSKEIKVATYLLLDLPSKTIANQMGISIQSINNYRFNLRKKMNIDKSITISDFLKKIG